MSTDTMTSSSSSSSSSVAKQFACTGCDLSFDRLEHLERHSRIHTGERPFACPFKGCDKHFSRRDNMSQHYRCHLHKGYRNQPREKREVLRKQFQTQGSAAALLLSVAEGNRGSGPSLLGGFISLSSSSSPSSSTSPSSSSSPSSPSSPPFSSRRLSRRRPPHLQTGAAESSASASSLSPSSSSSSPSPSLSPSSSMEHLPLTPRSGSSSCIGSPFHLGSEVIPSPPTTSSSAAPSTSSSGLFFGNESLPPILSLPAPVANQNMLVMSRIDTGMIGLLNQRLRIF